MSIRITSSTAGRIGALAGAAILAGTAALPAQAVQTPRFSVGIAINARGQVLGSFDDSAGNPFAGVFSASGKLTYLPYPAADQGDTGTAINDEGVVVGDVLVSDAGPGYVDFAALWSANGTLTALPNHGDSEAHGINDLGEAVGSDADATGRQLPVSWSATCHRETYLPLPSDVTSGSAMAVNSHGVILGSLRTANSEIGLLWEPDGKTVSLETPSGYTGSVPFALNNSGESIGYVTNASYELIPASWSSTGTVTVYKIPGNAEGSLTGVNDSGEVVGGLITSDSATAVTWSASGKETILAGVSGEQAYAANSVNDRGYIAGELGNSSGLEHAAKWTPSGEVIDLTALSGS